MTLKYLAEAGENN